MKTLKGTVVFLPTLIYILIFQILYPPQYAEFKNYYVADIVELSKNTADGKLEVVAEYLDDDGYYVLEIVKSDDIELKMHGEIDINGNKFSSDEIIMNIKGSNFILVSREKSIVENWGENYFTLKPLNEETTTSKVVISVGTVLGVLSVLLIVKAKLPTDIKITISLAVLTAFLFMLMSIIKDMFWVVVSLDVGWFMYLLMDKIPNKEQRFDKKLKKQQAKYYGL